MNVLKINNKKITFAIIILFIGMAIFPNIIQTSADELKDTEKSVIYFIQDFSTPKILKEQQNLEIELEESNSFVINQGGPKLPMLTKTFEFEWGTNINSVHVSVSEINTIDLDAKIEPIPYYRSSQSEYVVKNRPLISDIYESSDYYPSEWFSYKKGAGINEDGDHVLFLSVDVHPIRYLSKQDKIEYITSADIQISFEKPKESIGFADVYDLIVISPAQFSDSLQPLIEHKNSNEIRTILMTNEEIYDSYNGRDEAEKIKFFIKYALEEWGIKYVLFVGDIKLLPIRTTHSMMFTNHGDDILSDLYFGDIYDEEYNFCSWDKNGNDSFGEVIYNWDSWPPEIIDLDGVDLYADVHVGRLPCSNIEEVAMMVEKIINYEKQTYNKDWFKKIILAGGDTFPPRRLSDFNIFEGEITNKKVAEQLPDFEHVKLWATKRTLNAINFNIAINRGAGFLTYAGHGYEVGWGTYRPNSILQRKILYFTPYLYFLSNNYKMPIVFLDACLTSKLDFNVAELENYYPNLVRFVNFLLGNKYAPDDRLPCFAWAIMNLKNGGAIASVGATRTAYTGVSKDDVYAGAGYLDVSFFGAYTEGITVGEMLTIAQNQYINNVGKDYFTIEEFVLFGDPSLRVGGYQ